MKVECCAFIHDNSMNVSCALHNLHSQISTMSDSKNQKFADFQCSMVEKKAQMTLIYL